MIKGIVFHFKAFVFALENCSWEDDDDAAAITLILAPNLTSMETWINSSIMITLAIFQGNYYT